MVVFGQNSCIRKKVVVIEQKLLYSNKSCCIRAKRSFSDQLVVFVKKWL